MNVPWRIGRTISLLCFLFAAVQAHSYSRKPLNYLSLVENPEIETPSARVHAYSHFNLYFDLHQGKQQVKLTLEPNHNIIPDGASVQYLGQDGEIVRTELINRHAHKVFKGEAWIQGYDGMWTHMGWARIMIRRDGIEPLFEGAFTILGDHHNIQLRSNYMATKHALDPDAEHSDDEYMVIFRDSDIDKRLPMSHQELRRSDEVRHSCKSHELMFNSDPTQTVLKRDVGFWGAAPISSLFGKRQIDTNGIPSGGNSGSVNLKSTIGQSAGCPTSRKVALIGVATDCTYTGSFNSSESAHANVITQINSASNVYEKTFNISLGLQNLTVSDATCPGTPATATPWNTGCGGNTSITDRLNTFSQWRGDRNDTNAYWTLLTTCQTGAEVGLSWLGQLCVSDVTSSSGEVVSGANVVAKTSTEWQVIAHESGHTFGAVHDCDSQTCADQQTVNAQQCCPLSATSCDAQSKYIMNPSTAEGISAFSLCSLGNICSALGRNSVKSSCLSNNQGVTTITGQQCGNGIVEAGEDCDCGGTANCGNNTCCDPTTCKFKGSAVCDDSNEDCCHDCQFASGGTVCRASTGACDPQEPCSGTNSTCPPDVSAPDGQSCGNSSQSLQCASGQCTSRDQQCKTLMGSYTTKNDTYACDSQDCQLSCASPEFGPGACYSMQQNFLDGTTCGGGGKCNNGQCKGSSTAKEIGSWIHDNKKLVIGIAAGVGGLLLLSILSCIVRRCRRPRRPRRNQPMPPPMQQGWAGGPMSHGAWMSGAQQGRGGGWGGGYPNHGYVQPSVRYA
ncbi:hypothetical protein ABVK25_002750 [Lepraria finkii]|uniref:Disintegrin and metalloproteinase domain-containing protein B n=1 Tax=Lepraria finkii TaxID=1340010 RepID=A0ABR4BGQ7_9LECA